MEYGQTRGLFAGAFALTAFMAVPSFAQTNAPAPTFTKDVAPIFQEKCEVVPSARFDRADVARDLRGELARGRARSAIASQAAQMPPWHIDKTVGIQQFKNDRSLSDAQIDTIVKLGRRRRAEGRREGHAGSQGQWPTSKAGTSPNSSARRNPT